MTMTVKAIPDGYTGITPYLSILHASEAIEFYKQAFGAQEVMRLGGPDGRVGHAELKVNEARFMLGEPWDPAVAGAPRDFSALGLYLYVDDVDAFFNQAVAAGAEALMPPQDMFYGDRSGSLRDPYGYVWSLATHIEDVAPDDLSRRAEAMFRQGPCADQA
jgi:PhnB protein